MNNQKGQSLIEFALIVPMLIFLFLAILYMGITFLDYTQYNNAARDAARDISLIQTSTLRADIVEEINQQDSERLSRYASALTDLYTPTWNAKFVDEDGNDALEADAADVQVTIELKLTGVTTGSFLKSWDVLPDELKPIVYKMKLEEAKS